MWSHLDRRTDFRLLSDTFNYPNYSCFWGWVDVGYFHNSNDRAIMIRSEINTDDISV